MNKKLFDGWGFDVDTMFLSAGPCSAESEDQVLKTAHALKTCNVSFLRAGIWKPRTRPGCFEGVGIKGLAWMDRARAETGLKIGTEVAEPAHVDAVLAFDFDVVWIGARTVTNPFSVQAIANALKGSDMPVFVKNPISPDIGLWRGAVERIQNAGLKKVGMIHRGFSSTHEMRYRNAPDWKLPIEMKRLMPNLPMLCDPSHISGDRALVPGISQEAMDLLFDGLMVEVHPNPQEALSDMAQQLTPTQFVSMLASIELPKEKTENSTFQQEMSSLRGEVDQLDSRLLELLGERMDVVRKMGQLKRAESISTLQPNRWEQIIQDRVHKGISLQLSNDFLLELMELIHEEAIRQQEADRVKA